MATAERLIEMLRNLQRTRESLLMKPRHRKQTERWKRAYASNRELLNATAAAIRSLKEKHNA